MPSARVFPGRSAQAYAPRGYYYAFIRKHFRACSGNQFGRKGFALVLAAKERGILFDVGHGGAGFWFDQAIPSFEQGLWPNSFGTDLHRFSMNAGMKDMLNVMSKYLNIGMPLKEVLLRGSWYPAKAIKREDLGNLSPGSVADVAILSLRKGEFGFIDARNNGIKGDKKLEAEMTIREGKIVWDLNGLAAKPFERK